MGSPFSRRVHAAQNRSHLQQRVDVLCLSGDLIGEKLADHLVEVWLKTPFEGGRYARRNGKIEMLESVDGSQ